MDAKHKRPPRRSAATVAMKRTLRYTINTFLQALCCCYDLCVHTSTEQKMKKMWFLLSLASCCAASLAQVAGQMRESGFSDQYKSQNTLGEYTFGYNEDHTSGGSFRRETSDRLGNKVGSYGLRVGDGRVRIVNYVADHNGFRADVVSNEPGVESQDSNPFSRISKKNMYTILVPGFKYSSAAPYVTFHGNQQDDRPYDGMMDEGGRSFDEEFDGEGVSNAYFSEEGRDEDLGNAFLVEDGSFGTQYSEGEPNNAYMNEGQVLEDAYLSGEYSHDSETVLQNQTDSAQVEGKASEVSPDHQDIQKDASELNDSLSDLHLTYENKYHSYSTMSSEDLQPFQSSVVLSKSKEPATQQDQENGTLPDSDEFQRENATTVSTTLTA